MGEQNVNLATEGKGMHQFIRALITDVRALEYMLDNQWFETDTIRIGAEQEMCLVNRKTYKPAMVAMQALRRMKDYPWCGTELAQFNLETNLSPQVFTGDCFSKLEAENQEQIALIREKVKKLGVDVILTGILPTLRKFDLALHNLTPVARYKALIESINQQQNGSAFELRLMGIDELLVKHDSPLLEACNTSYQVHLQVTPDSFVKMYNIAQTLAAPVMAIAANSPIVFGKRLWHETRIALFQQALDTRGTLEHMRERSPRVNFGSGWLNNSIMDIYKEDIARFRVLLGTDIEENSLEQIAEGKVPKLKALQVHNSTVYRWNRPCYGISDNGKPHLRIENRVLPSGPTVLDEVANAAFWVGTMEGMAQKVDDIRGHISWADVRDNFVKAARLGVDTNFTWFDDRKISANDLILQELLPMARAGLTARGINQADIDKYMGVIEERAARHATGARWQLRTYTKLKEQVGRDEALSAMTACIINNQTAGKPIHTWEIPAAEDMKNYRPSSLKVEEFMETDLFTCQHDDLIELVAEIMDWRRLRYMPVENKKGELSGLVTSRSLLRYYARMQHGGKGKDPVIAKDIMIRKPTTISPSATIIEAIGVMRSNRIGCLPVVINDNELVGIITEMDYLRISSRLMERLDKKK